MKNRDSRLYETAVSVRFTLKYLKNVLASFRKVDNPTSSLVL